MYPSVQLLIFADDLIMFNDTVGRLQHQANILSQFCWNYMWTINLSKANVIVFRNGGIIRGNEKVFLWFSSRTCFNLFETNIVPILLYSVEVWGYTIIPDIENIHIKCCKYILGVSRNTSSCAVLGECRLKLLYVLYIKYWLKCVQFSKLSKYPK